MRERPREHGESTHIGNSGRGALGNITEVKKHRTKLANEQTPGEIRNRLSKTQG